MNFDYLFLIMKNLIAIKHEKKKINILIYQENNKLQNIYI